MSKLSKTSLTGSRRIRRWAALTECLDELMHCQARLTALAEMMMACNEIIHPDSIREIGMLIAQEASRLDKLKDLLERQTR